MLHTLAFRKLRRALRHHFRTDAFAKVTGQRPSNKPRDRLEKLGARVLPTGVHKPTIMHKNIVKARFRHLRQRMRLGLFKVT